MRLPHFFCETASFYTLYQPIKFPFMELFTKLVKTLASPMGEARADSDLVNSAINCDFRTEKASIEEGLTRPRSRLIVSEN